MKCQCCDAECIKKRPDFHSPFNWYCKKCTTLHVPLYDPDIYDKDYRDDYLQRLNSPTNEPIQRIRWNLVKSQLNGGIVLDIGCGVGAFLRACPSDFSVVGQEINPTCVEYCQGDKLKVSTELPEQQFDAITMFDVLEHFPQLDSLNTIKNLLAPNGYLFITVPNFTKDLLDDIKNWKHYKPYEHIHLFSVESIKAIASKYGFQYLSTNWDESEIRKPHRSISSHILRAI